MADTVAQFVQKTASLHKGFNQLEHRMAEISARVIKLSVLAELQIAGVQGGKLRGVGKRGAKIGVHYLVKDRTAFVKATGPFQFIEGDTQAHRMPRARKTARAKKRVVVIPGVGVRAYANHPGTKGKHPWAKGVVASAPIQHKAHQLALADTIRRAYQ